MRPLAFAIVPALSAVVLAAGCSPSSSQTPACTNEGSAQPYGDAGVLPPRSLPNGYPCATGAVCYATIDDCPGDWPDAAAIPASSGATPFMCDCIQGVWSCEAETETPPVCVSSGASSDGGVD
jgi:hypothetical protein